VEIAVTENIPMIRDVSIVVKEMEIAVTENIP
jgi:hypothetical protein